MTFAPRAVAVQASKVTVVESPAARLVTFLAFEYVPMRKVTGNVAADVPWFLTRACGLTDAPESTVPVGAKIRETPASCGLGILARA